jgi:hypothetical protein
MLIWSMYEEAELKFECIYIYDTILQGFKEALHKLLRKSLNQLLLSVYNWIVLDHEFCERALLFLKTSGISYSQAPGIQVYMKTVT